ncbi:hypothetical protein LCGC14_1022970 [marine sediment metagenome]|uniref:Uncharacterized protein n=1 Tax=marine sediment metagenome TaxID=412755 RepID=A0A0F9NII8_9ZZZZ|nr:hypothetical protein [Candidatus Aminicenantes bacterium]
MKLITRIHNIVNFAVNKGFTGYHSPPEIDNEIYAVIMDTYNEFASEYAKNSRIRDYMAPFLVTEEKVDKSSTDGSFEKPDKFEHSVLLQHEDLTEIEEIDNAAWAFRIKDPVSPPSAEYPICKFNSTTFSILPVKNTAAPPVAYPKVLLTYLKTPTPAVLKYTVQNGRIIVNDAGSTEIEFGPLLHNTIRDKVLSALGINLREPAIVEYSNAIGGSKVQ